MDSEDLLYLLYTSGTTAKPKGIIHTTAGYLVGVSTTHHYIFDVKPDSIYWCAADIGWVTGHSYIVFGPLGQRHHRHRLRGHSELPRQGPLVGDRRALQAGHPVHRPDDHPNPHAVGPEYAAKHDLSSLRLLGSVGEPINPEAWIWYREHIGGNRTPVVDTWWQTETGMILITPLPGVTTLKPGSATRPFPTVDAAVYNDAGKEVPPGGGGYLVIRKPWPAMLRGISATPSVFKRRTGIGGRTRISSATGPASMRTATSGCSAESTT
jgi:acetyl-CoA synthetase